MRARRFRRPLLLAAAAWLGAPGAAAESQPGLRELVEVVDLAVPTASPDGRMVAFRETRPSIQRNSYELSWHVLDTGSGRVRRIAAGGEPIVVEPGVVSAEPPIWSSDGRWIYYRALQAGEVQIWRSAADGSRSDAVTAEAGDVLSIERARDGRGIAYRVGPARAAIEQAELAEYDSGILVDEHIELGQNLFRGAIVNGRRATQRLTGTWFSRGNILWAQAPRERRLDFATLARSDAPTAGSPEPPSGARPEPWALSSAGDIATSDWDGAQGSLNVVRAGRTGTTLPCPAAECRRDRVAWAAWRPGKDQLLFASMDRALVQTLRLWDLSSGQVRTIVRGNGLMNGGRDENSPCAILTSEAVCVIADPRMPPRLEAIDLANGSSRLLLDPAGAHHTFRGPWIERLSWRSPEGSEFTAVLFLPEGAPSRPLPLFVNYYRCEGYIRGGLGDEWPFALLASRGIASVCVNATRISGPQDSVATYRAALSGLETLVDILANRGLVDRSRVGMGGLSFGSEVTFWTLIHSNLVSAASVATPDIEPVKYWFSNMRGRDHGTILRQAWGLGSPDETPERWRLISAALNVERIRAPLLLQLAEQESRYGVELYTRLSHSPTPMDLYVFPDEGHIKVQPRHRLAVYRRNIDWFRFWLQDHVDPDPAKAEQYRRWRAMAARRAEAQARQERSQSSSEARSNIRK
ncbi:MAG TPA: Atxe2 family lasso peptide isopeptidase [Allosphingosinicella sp.]